MQLNVDTHLSYGQQTESTMSMQTFHDVEQQESRKQGLLFVLSAPSGTGKDTVIAALKASGIDFHVVISVTTRAARPGESEGNPYYFVNQQTFDQMVAQDALLEHALVHGNWYGQPLQQVKDHLQAGRDVILKIDVQGAATVRRKLPNAVFIFLMPDSIEELESRLLNRHTETDAERIRRLNDARTELAQRDHYDYTVINRQGQIDEAVKQIRAIMLAEHCRTHPRYVTM
ncbi:MAG TPA: guanylate kinase [Ktedonobacter sp.]|nr:guanylate kinase [Ktedonobacter sp.]